MPFLRTVARVALIGLWLACPAAVLLAHPGHDHGDDPAQPPADFNYDPADVTVESTVFENRNWYDADVASVDGRLWYAWLEFMPGKGDQVWVGLRAGDQDGEKWSHKRPVTADFGSYACPTLTVDSAGRVWLSYEGAEDEQWDVFALRLDEEGEPVGEAVRVSPGPGADIRHDAAADSDGGLWLVWQSDVDGQFDIVARHFTGEDWQDVVPLSEAPRGDWHPQIEVNSTGDVLVAWDGFDGESYNIYLRSRRADQWSDVRLVAGKAAFEGRVDLAIDHQDRAWLVWEEGGENWGMPYTGIDTTSVGDELGPLHRFRRLRLAIVGGDGAVHEFHSPLPMPSLDAAARRGNAKDTKHTGAFYERARLAVDDAGRVWLAYRHFYAPWLGVEHRSHVEHGWGVYARYFGEEGWSPLHKFDIGQGDGLQRLELTPSGEGVAAVWTTGRTDRRENDRPRGIVAASIAGEGKAYGKAPVGEYRIFARPVSRPVTHDRPTMKVSGATFQLFYGDLHRHTDLSLCRVPIDGTIDDAYRYAGDVARLDFLGITDHSRDIAQGDALSQLWWRSRKEVYRHQLGTRFLPFYAYERSHGDTADHNVISLRGDMLRPHTYPIPKFWEELNPADTFTIPHQPIRRLTWVFQNDMLRPLLEIYQGCRDASIEDDAHRGLGKGYLLGFIASSDHMSTSASYACVWAEEPSRESIFAAMKARRTFGATAKIQLAVRAGDHWMGEEIRADRLPPLELTVTGTAPIRSIELIVDGKVTQVFSPKKREARLRVPLDLAGEHYVYFHLTQADGNQAWSSPLFLKPAN
jgi:hypothetical protein